MADVSGAKINWQTVSYADWQENNATAVNNRLTAARLNALGQAIRNVNAELSTVGGIGPGDYINLEDSNEYFLHIHIPDDGSPTVNWPDRLSFFFEDGSPGGRRSGYFNEYGELRARPAKTNTIGFRSMGHNGAPVSQEFFQVAVDADQNTRMLAVNKEYINVYAPMRHAPSDTPLSNVIVIDQGESVPVGTPEGTVVVVRPL